jgi:hypothetical protein
MKTLELTNEQYDLLMELQKELKTQDHRSTANPIYFIQRRIKEYGIDADYAEGTDYMIGGKIYTEDELKEYIVQCYSEELESFINETDDINNIDDIDSDIYMLDDLIDFVNETEIDEIICKIHYRYQEVVHEYSFSLFEKDSLDHIDLNGHNIGGQYYTYVGSNQKTPRMNKLRELLLELKIVDNN